MSGDRRSVVNRRQCLGRMLTATAAGSLVWSVLPGFRIAGARNLLMTLWPLNDRLAALAFLRTLDSDRLAYSASIWAAWYGDTELALEAMRRSDTTFAYWYPVMKDVRRHPGFKELARDMNLVEYWREYGWADSCRPVGEEDFECQ